MIRRFVIALVLIWAPVGPARAESALVAVASNFLPTASLLAAEYSQTSGDDIRIASGSTGKLFAQIHAGAPFDVLLSADVERPKLLVAQGLAEADSLKVYALGQLVWWSVDPSVVPGNASLDVLADHVRNGAPFALADPDLAPYGRAAQQVLVQASGRDAPNAGARIVTGENVAQAFTFIATGNAQSGLVPLSMVRRQGAGGFWVVPASLYDPIRQAMVVLAHGAGNKAAKGFAGFVLSDQGQRMIAAAGYGLEHHD